TGHQICHGTGRSRRLGLPLAGDGLPPETMPLPTTLSRNLSRPRRPQESPAGASGPRPAGPGGPRWPAVGGPASSLTLGVAAGTSRPAPFHVSGLVTGNSVR